MITKQELEKLLKSTETSRIEKTTSTTNTDKFCEAICAFSNDMSGSRQNGYLLLGVTNDGNLSGLQVTDELMVNISAIRSSGNILPIPSMTVAPFTFQGGDVLVVEVSPSLMPPVRYKGRTYIRVGPRKDIATMEEERILSERVTANYPTFDTTPCREATIDDLDVLMFQREYLPKAIDIEEVSSDTRGVKEQMAALRLFNLQHDCPTYAGVILFGKNPKYFLLGDYIQYVHFQGRDNASTPLNEYEFNGNLMSILPQLDTFIGTALIQKRPVPISALRETTRYNYPQWAIRELMMNAVMHRDYLSTTPTKLYQYADRLEIANAGGLYGDARPENFPNVNAYRNPIVAEAMKVLGYVNKYNRGVARVQSELEENGNGRAEFTVDKITVFEAQVRISGDASDYSDTSTTNKVANNATNNVTNNALVGIASGTYDLEAISRQLTDRSLLVLTKIGEVDSIRSKELFKLLGLTNQSYNYGSLRLLSGLGLIEPTSDKLKSPKQSYRITALGRGYLTYKKGVVR